MGAFGHGTGAGVRHGPEGTTGRCYTAGVVATRDRVAQRGSDGEQLGVDLVVRDARLHHACGSRDPRGTASELVDVAVTGDRIEAIRPAGTLRARPPGS